ncbi:trypsin-like peptidase domain-containing protein [bacterium]|nr:trypsin-like peptidase domain-containing protein [bacterium]
MNTKKFFLTVGFITFSTVFFAVSYKLFTYHKHLQELLSIVQVDSGHLEQNITMPSIVEKVVGKSQLWRPVQDAVKDSVVQIFVQGVQMDLLQPYKTPHQFSAGGSGFLISESGEIATNAHVVRNAQTIWIQIPSLGKKILDAHVIGECPDRDIALLQLTEESQEYILNELETIPFLTFGNSDLVRRSDEVMALGYPLGMQSLKSTTGVISGREGGLIQISAAINAGNSGGPLLNLNGEVIGINSSKIVGGTVDNIAYMIPINDFRIALPDLKTNKLLRKPFLGVLFNNGTDDLTDYLGNPPPGGCYVADVIKNSTLYNAGVESGDMIYEINGNKVDIYGEMNVVWSEDRISLVDYVGRLSVGQDINLIVYRNGERKELSAKFTEAKLLAIRQVYPWIEDVDYEVFAGMVVMQLTTNHVRMLVKQAPGLLAYTELKNQTDPALIVTHVFPTSQLYKTRTISMGAQINEVNGISINTLQELRQAYQSGDNKRITIRATDLYTRASDNILVVLPQEKILKEEPQLSRLYHYPLSETAKTLFAQHMQSAQNVQKNNMNIGA